VKFTIPKETIDYEADILEYIKNKPEGVTITDISEDTEFSRNTVSKYVSILGLKKKIFSRKVGAYKLYFNAEEISFPKIFTIAYYKGLLSGLKRNFPNSEKIFKQIGRNCYEYIDFSLGPMISKELKGFKVNRLIKIYYEVFGRFYPTYEVAQPSIDISVQKIDKNNTRTILKFSNSEYLQTNDDFILHAYIIAGLIEELWKKEAGRIIKCNVGNVYISDKKEESYYELYLDIDRRTF
jgi:hypothetical protein